MVIFFTSKFLVKTFLFEKKKLKLFLRFMSFSKNNVLNAHEPYSSHVKNILLM